MLNVICQAMRGSRRYERSEATFAALRAQYAADVAQLEAEHARELAVDLGYREVKGLKKTSRSELFEIDEFGRQNLGTSNSASRSLP